MGNAPNNLSRSQVDRLGERLRDADPTQDDLRMLDQYRRSFGEAYSFVVRLIRERTKLNPTGRPAKSTTAIREKLRRESVRLTQMQDIAGCRIVVEDISDQDSAVEDLRSCFTDVAVVDRRKTPSHGYRAVHVIVHHNNKQVEVQVRTRRQHQGLNSRSGWQTSLIPP